MSVSGSVLFHPIQNLKCRHETVVCCVDLQELVHILRHPRLIVAHVPRVAAVAEPRVDGLVHVDHVGSQVPPIRVPRQSLVVVVDGEGTILEEQRKLAGTTRTYTKQQQGMCAVPKTGLQSLSIDFNFPFYKKVRG